MTTLQQEKPEVKEIKLHWRFLAIAEGVDVPTCPYCKTTMTLHGQQNYWNLSNKRRFFCMNDWCAYVRNTGANDFADLTCTIEDEMGGGYAEKLQDAFDQAMWEALYLGIRR